MPGEGLIGDHVAIVVCSYYTGRVGDTVTQGTIKKQAQLGVPHS